MNTNDLDDVGKGFLRYFELERILDGENPFIDEHVRKNLEREKEQLHNSYNQLFLQVKSAMNLNPSLSFRDWMKQEYSQLTDILRITKEVDDITDSSRTHSTPGENGIVENIIKKIKSLLDF